MTPFVQNQPQLGLQNLQQQESFTIEKPTGLAAELGEGTIHNLIVAWAIFTFAIFALLAKIVIDGTREAKESREKKQADAGLKITFMENDPAQYQILL
eukprot:CAMPEP_0170482724 /NCGR_PEP_ID=MMETSP0208-20121228/2613_1 /TAXON_ID=197538 /ORGANISM="Strombidium inclinatum, Strain S3" /LENGTH=97 /DNA_ID=CAMNT_0010755587 /DNA_START=123 /DNA_END=416 /DNA_ORIENTATION=-